MRSRRPFIAKTLLTATLLTAWWLVGARAIAQPPETPKPETPKPETPKPETPKPETLKPETLKPETLKPETLKPETLKPETLKPETPKPETPKPETPRPEPLRPEASPSANRFELRIVRIGNTYQGFRFRTDTGESWQIAGGAWQKVVEADPVPLGRYDILLLTAQGGQEGFLAMRVDHVSGHTWFLQARQWVKYDEPEERAERDPKTDAKPNGKPDAKTDGNAALAAAKSKNFEFRQARVGDMLHLVRFDIKTGAAWVLRGTGAYERLAETGPVPEGDYDLTTVATDKTWMAFRLDRRSGTAWLLRNNTWHRVKDPEPEPE
jgi:hypothetical protein